MLSPRQKCCLCVRPQTTPSDDALLPSCSKSPGQHPHPTMQLERQRPPHTAAGAAAPTLHHAAGAATPSLHRAAGGTAPSPHAAGAAAPTLDHLARAAAPSPHHAAGEATHHIAGATRANVPSAGAALGGSSLSHEGWFELCRFSCSKSLKVWTAISRKMTLPWLKVCLHSFSVNCQVAAVSSLKTDVTIAMDPFVLFTLHMTFMSTGNPAATPLHHSQGRRWHLLKAAMPTCILLSFHPIPSDPLDGHQQKGTLMCFHLY